MPENLGLQVNLTWINKATSTSYKVPTSPELVNIADLLPNSPGLYQLVEGQLVAQDQIIRLCDIRSKDIMRPYKRRRFCHACIKSTWVQTVLYFAVETNCLD